MRGRWIGAALAAGLALALAGSVWAQQPKQAPAFEHDPDLDAADQLAPSQVQQQMPAAVAVPTRPSAPSARTVKRTVAHATVNVGDGAKTHVARAGIPQIVACSGVFAKDSNHRKLAMAFESKNVAYTQVDAATGGKMASVLYPKDPKRRLEVWWSDPISRSNTHLIVINGESAWTAPGGVSLGLTLAELETLNGKPFKLLGFNKDGVAALSSWNGGALATLPGGCELGLSLRAGANAPQSAVQALPADHVYSSTDAGLRAVAPTVSEILVGY
jgi:hypothetical protein